MILICCNKCMGCVCLFCHDFCGVAAKIPAFDRQSCQNDVCVFSFPGLKPGAINIKPLRGFLSLSFVARAEARGYEC